MKRAVRWIGVGITVAAAATMLLADVALAVPGGRAPGLVGMQDMHSDVPAPTVPVHDAGATCGTAVHRPGRAATMTIVDPGDRTEYQNKTFVRLD